MPISALTQGSLLAATTIETSPISQIVLSASKQIWYCIVYGPGVVPGGIVSVPKSLIITPVSPPSFTILILSSIFAFVAGKPEAKSVPFPLFLNILCVVPPRAESTGGKSKSSS